MENYLIFLNGLYDLNQHYFYSFGPIFSSYFWENYPKKLPRFTHSYYRFKKKEPVVLELQDFLLNLSHFNEELLQKMLLSIFNLLDHSQSSDIQSYLSLWVDYSNRYQEFWTKLVINSFDSYAIKLPVSTLIDTGFWKKDTNQKKIYNILESTPRIALVETGGFVDYLNIKLVNEMHQKQSIDIPSSIISNKISELEYDYNKSWYPSFNLMLISNFPPSNFGNLPQQITYLDSYDDPPTKLFYYQMKKVLQKNQKIWAPVFVSYILEVGCQKHQKMQKEITNTCKNNYIKKKAFPTLRELVVSLVEPPTLSSLSAKVLSR